jgi:hypothetical protein
MTALERLDDEFEDLPGRTLQDMMIEQKRQCDEQAYPL